MVQFYLIWKEHFELIGGYLKAVSNMSNFDLQLIFSLLHNRQAVRTMLTVIFISAISGFIVITIDLIQNFHGRGSALRNVFWQYITGTF